MQAPASISIRAMPSSPAAPSEPVCGSEPWMLLDVPPPGAGDGAGAPGVGDGATGASIVMVVDASKAELMNSRWRWAHVALCDVAEHCEALSLHEGDVCMIVELVARVQDGKRLGLPPRIAGFAGPLRAMRRHPTRQDPTHEQRRSRAYARRSSASLGRLLRSPVTSDAASSCAWIASDSLMSLVSTASMRARIAAARSAGFIACT